MCLPGVHERISPTTAAPLAQTAPTPVRMPVVIKRWQALALALATVLVTAGCGTPTVTVARGIAPAPVRTEEIDRPALAARAQRVLLPPAATAPLGVTVEPEEKLDYASAFDSEIETSEYCNKWVFDQGSPRTHVMHRRKWIEPGRIVVVSKAHGYGSITAAHAVDTTRDNAGLCQRYVLGIRAEREIYELLDIVDPGVLPGVDVHYGRCAKVTSEDPDDPPLYTCAVFLARGDLLSHVEVWTTGSVDAARTALLSLVPAATAALTRG
jgi:hypothetical protein